jgi:hypothetical protein
MYSIFDNSEGLSDLKVIHVLVIVKLMEIQFRFRGSSSSMQEFDPPARIIFKSKKDFYLPSEVTTIVVMS